MPDFRVFGPRGGAIIRRAPIRRVRAVLPALVRRFGRVSVREASVPVRPAPTVREKVVLWARWGVQHTEAIHYAETRPMPAKLETPLTTDCSGFVTLCYKAAGAEDPNGLGYNGEGYTGTLLAHAEKHGRVFGEVSKARAGDLIVYGPGAGEHVAIVVEPGKDPLTVSHGSESEPAYVRVSQDGRQPQRVCSTIP